jgi:hypothetical protein
MFLPLFDSLGVDLFLSGHSHNYERSYLIHGHYGTSETYNPELHLISGLSGNKDLGEAYIKKHKGTIYAVVGNSGASSADNNILHPVMYMDYAGSDVGGSMIIDIRGDELTGKYINHEGSIIDQFTLVKQGNINTSNKDFTNLQNRTDFRIFPNPSTGKLHLHYNAPESGTASIEIISANGSSRGSRLFHIAEGNNLIDMPEWLELPAGIYFIRLQLNGMVYSEKAVKLN